MGLYRRGGVWSRCCQSGLARESRPVYGLVRLLGLHHHDGACECHHHLRSSAAFPCDLKEQLASHRRVEAWLRCHHRSHPLVAGCSAAGGWWCSTLQQQLRQEALVRVGSVMWICLEVGGRTISRKVWMGQ